MNLKLDIFDAPMDLGTHVETWGPFDRADWTEAEIQLFADSRCKELNKEHPNTDYFYRISELKTPSKKAIAADLN